MELIFLIIALIASFAISDPVNKQRVLPWAFSEGKIVDDEVRNEVIPAIPGKRPFQVSLQDTSLFSGVHFCGGAIVNRNYIITTWLCVHEYKERPQHLQIVAGEFIMGVSEGREQAIAVSEVKLHPDFSITDWRNNIAILKLSTPLEFDNYTQPIDLPYNGLVPSGKCTNSGWGTSSPDEDNYSYAMHQNNVNVLSTSQCHDDMDELGHNKKHVLCAGEGQNDMSTCIGDDGGPLTCLDNGKPYLAGILSYNLNCRWSPYPDVYTSIENYNQWIMINTYPWEI